LYFQRSICKNPLQNSPATHRADQSHFAHPDQNVSRRQMPASIIKPHWSFWLPTILFGSVYRRSREHCHARSVPQIHLRRDTPRPRRRAGARHSITGFYRNKAKSIRAMAAALVEHHHGNVPKSMEELTALAGVVEKPPTSSWATPSIKTSVSSSIPTSPA